MIHPFSISTVLRMIPQKLLREFLAKLGHTALPIDWQSLQPWDVRPILHAIKQFDSRQLMLFENIMHQVFDLASDSGVMAIREVGGKIFWSEIPKTCNPYCLAMRTWLRHSNVFNLALLLQQVNHCGDWSTRRGLPKVTPKTSDEVLQQLGNAISDAFRHDRDISGHCTVEYMRRSDGSDYFMAYADDVPRIRLAHDQEGHLASHVIRPTLEIVFAYNRVDGELEMFALTSQRLRTKLENAFCEIILGNGVSENPPRPAYNLNVLKEGPSRLVTDPKDGVVACVWQIRLALRNSRRHIILEADYGSDREDVFMMLDEYLNRQRLPMSLLNVMAAEFCFSFRAVDGQQREPISFGLVCPNLCTLRNQRPSGVRIVRKYLRQWRIAVA